MELTMNQYTEKMKKLFLAPLLLAGICACHNFETDFPDFDYTTGYFPYQFPVRVLVLGDYIYDNSNDNQHKFVISAAIGGVYQNKQDRVFDYVVDESLCEGILFGTGGDTIKALPKAYYTLSDAHQIVVPKGKFNGGIEIQLTDAFFNDPDAIKNTYVVPLRLTGSHDVDSLLSGKSSRADADIRISGMWEVAPKNFTMFGIKYINEWHGNYLHYGKSTVADADGTILETNTYSTEYVEQNEVYKLVTNGRRQVALTCHPKSAILSANEDPFLKTLTLLFDFDGDSCTISAPEGADYTVSGSGTFKKGAYSFGNKSRNGIEYTFSCSDGKRTYKASDVLVARDRGVVLETFNPVLK